MSDIKYYPNTTVPISLIKFKDGSLGIVTKSGFTCNVKWRTHGHAFDVSAKSIEWYDLDTKNTYTNYKNDVVRVSQEEYDNLSQDKKDEILKYCK